MFFVLSPAEASSRITSYSRDNTYQNITSNPKEINNTFTTLFSPLYTSEFPSDTTFFLDHLEIPTLEPEDAEDLAQALELEEINNTIMAMQSGKTSRLDC